MDSDAQKRVPTTKKTYDHLFKEILEVLPSHHIIAFLNSLFNHKMPLDSTIESIRTESNMGETKIADYILKVTEPDGTKRNFHLEAQTTDSKQMAFRMIEYGVRFALNQAKDGSEKDQILLEFPHAVVFYLKDGKTTPKEITVTIRTPDEQELQYIILAERMSDYTPVQLLEQEKYPLFPFYMANFNGKNPGKFQQEWEEGCAKLHELVTAGCIDRVDAQRLLESGNTIIKKCNHPNEKEVLKKMESMFDYVGVGVDWLEIKRQKDEAVAEAKAEVIAERKAVEHEKAVAVAKQALEMGLSLGDIVKLSGLPVDEIMLLSKE